METRIVKICCGCLNNGRKMVAIRDIHLLKCFLEIINKNRISIYGSELLQLCYECTALLSKFTNFKLQVAASYKTFQNYSKRKSKPFTRLNKDKLPNLDITHQPQKNKSTEVLVQDIKTESDTDDVLDDVLDADYVEELSNQEDLLVERTLDKVKKKKKKPMIKIKKERELEFIEVILNEREIEQEREMLALRDDYVNAMFTCSNCILTFPNEEDLKEHVHVKHDLNASIYKCAVCTCSFRTEVTYNYHVNKHTRRYQCVVCADMFASKRTASKHYGLAHCRGTEHELDENIIQTTNQNTGRKSKEKVKDLGAQEKSTFPCQFCAKIFKWRTSLRKHVEKHRIETGEKRKPYCEPCRLTFTTTPNLQKHVRTSSKHKILLKLRKLNGNDVGTQKQSKMKAILMDEIKSTVTKSQPKYFCQQCDKVFLWRGNLSRHLHSHTAKAKGDLVCKPCNRTFSSIATYQQHMKISKKHVSEEDFKYMCSDCGRRFPTKMHLRDHINWEHLKNFVYTCDECQKVFKTSNSVYLHKQAVHQKHTLEHLCDHCGKPFPNNAKLRSHILGIHSGGVPHQCALCDAKFSWQSCLSRHVRQKHRKVAEQ